MLYWECKKRLESLRAFRVLVQTYFDNVSSDEHYGGHPDGDETATRVRGEINRELGYIQQSLDKLGHASSVYYTPPPLIGGFTGHLNILSNIFRLSDFHIEEQMVFDVLDSGIGRYERHVSWLSKQRFNPFYWLKLLLVSILRFPFKILGAAGFDSRKIEESLIGRIIKAVVGFVIFLAALLQALDYLGMLDRLRKLLGSF